MTYDFENSETDPMLGDEATQNAYRKWLAGKVSEARDEIRAEHRQPIPDPETEPVMIGAVGFSGNLSSSH